MYTLQVDSLILTPQVLKQIFFDTKTNRYKWSDTQKFVSKDVVRALIDDKLEQEKEALIKYSERIKSNEIGVYSDVAKTLKNIHVLEVAKIKDGFENITQSDLGTVGNQLKKQYYAGKDEKTGKPFGLKYLFQEAPNQSIGQIENRLRMFAESGNISASVVEQSTNVIAGKTSMKRMLGANHDNCEDCLKYAAMGWQSIGSLPLPKTKCRCRSNCRCKVIYE